MERPDDSFLTVAAAAETASRERSSKFLAYAYPVRDEERIRELLDALRKRYFDATHHCYAWRLGPGGERFRANDDGEPSGTAGKPILVRYFGGTKLGVPGLIAAYREAAAEVLDAAGVEERTVDRTATVRFPYESMNDIMKIIKEEQPAVRAQEFDCLCSVTLSIRASRAEALFGRLAKVGGAALEEETT